MSAITNGPLRLCRSLYSGRGRSPISGLNIVIPSSYCTVKSRIKDRLKKKMGSERTLPKLFKFVDENVSTYKELLKEAVAIPSVSSDPQYRDDCVRMVHWTQEKLKELGASTELRDVGFQILDDQKIKLPPVLVGTLGNDPKKNTICIYGHLDVQPALKSDGWLSEPFELEERDGKLFGRGSTDDKGPVLGWIHAINAYKGTGEELPVNLKFVFECMEESGSEGLDELLMDKLKPEGFFDTVDYVCISDNYWLGTTKPCITYGLRGISYYFLEIECAKMDLHSGVYGGTVHEAMSDLIYLMNTLVDKDGKILITDIYKSVAPLTESEKGLYESIDFSPEAYSFVASECVKMLEPILNKVKRADVIF